MGRLRNEPSAATVVSIAKLISLINSPRRANASAGGGGGGRSCFISPRTTPRGFRAKKAKPLVFARMKPGLFSPGPNQPAGEFSGSAQIGVAPISLGGSPPRDDRGRLRFIVHSPVAVAEVVLA